MIALGVKKGGLDECCPLRPLSSELGRPVWREFWGSLDLWEPLPPHCWPAFAHRASPLVPGLSGSSDDAWGPCGPLPLEWPRSHANSF